MDGNEHPSKRALRAERERTIEVLSDAFARDELGLAEFERRLDGAYACAHPDEFGALTRDLSTAAQKVPPTLAVECLGTAVLGSFETTRRVPIVSDPEAPLLRVRGSAILGNVEVRTRVRRRR